MPRRFLERIFLPAAWGGGGTGPPIFAGDGGGVGGGVGVETTDATCSGEFAGIVSTGIIFFLEDDRLRLDLRLNRPTTVLRVLEKIPVTKLAARETAFFV